MNKILFLFFIVIFLLLNLPSYAKNIYEVDFTRVNVNTENVEKTKNKLIEEIKYKNLDIILNTILTSQNRKKFYNSIKNYNIYNDIVNNIIIENEIITNKKYIADIKINFNLKKFILFLRNQNIPYTDAQSNPFLILSSYDNDFINAGLEKNNFLLDFVDKDNFKNNLINFVIPNLDTNDRYLLSYDKMIKEDISSFSKITKKYKVKDSLYFKIYNFDSNTLELQIKNFDSYNNSFYEIGKLNFKYDNNLDKHNNQKKFVNDILIFLDDWWKNKMIINNAFINFIECTISSNNFDDLNNIKSIISNLSQVSKLYTKKISLNSNIELIKFYGNKDVLIKSLEIKNVLIENDKNCNIKYILN